MLAVATAGQVWELRLEYRVPADARSSRHRASLLPLPYRAGSERRRRQERSIRADQLDAFVFAQVREALLRPDVLLAGERAVASRTPTPDDELLTAQLQSLDCKLEHSEAERRRLLDVYQTGLVELAEFQRRVGDLDLRRRQLTIQKEAMVTQRRELVHDNRLRQRVGAFAERIRDGLDELTFEQRQRLLRLVVEQVRVQGWQVEIRLRILSTTRPTATQPRPKRPTPRPSVDMRLRSVGVDESVSLSRENLLATSFAEQVPVLVDRYARRTRRRSARKVDRAEILPVGGHEAPRWRP